MLQLLPSAFPNGDILDFSPNGRFLLLQYRDNNSQWSKQGVYDINTGALREVVATYNPVVHQARGFSPDNRVIVQQQGPDDEFVHLWRTQFFQ